MRSEQSVQAKIVPRRVIVLNWTNDVDPLVEAFADFSPPGTEVVFVHQQQQQCRLPKRVRSVRFRQVLPAAAEQVPLTAEPSCAPHLGA